MTERAPKIPCADFDVCFGIKKILRHESLDALGFDPILRRRFGHLHESAFAMAADFFRMETAFLPDDGFDQQRIHAVAPGGGGDRIVIGLESSEPGPFGKTISRIFLGKQKDSRGHCEQDGEGAENNDDPSGHDPRKITRLSPRGQSYAPAAPFFSARGRRIAPQSAALLRRRGEFPRGAASRLGRDRPERASLRNANRTFPPSLASAIGAH